MKFEKKKCLDEILLKYIRNIVITIFKNQSLKHIILST